MKNISPDKNTLRTGTIAICGNPNCGKTTIFNAITGLSQQVGNYSGVTVEKVSGQFGLSSKSLEKYNLIDIPGTYSLSAFTPDEYIAASALYGELEQDVRPDAIIVVLDATNLERGFYFLYQVLQIGTPIVIAVNMVDLAARKGLKIDYDKLSAELKGVAVVPVVGNRAKGIDKLKEEIIKAVNTTVDYDCPKYEIETEKLLSELMEKFHDSYHSRAQYLRIIFDVNGPAEKKFIKQQGDEAFEIVKRGRTRIKRKYGSLAIAEIKALTDIATESYQKVVTKELSERKALSDSIDKYLLHPVLGPIVLMFMMLLVFQSIFSWSEPFMHIIDSVFSSIAGIVEQNMADGPLRSLLTDGIIGGVGSVLIFIPQIAILFIFITVLEDSGYMPRAAFIVDRMFRWCGLSGKSFIPMLSSFACAVPGIMATRTIEDRKLRIITIMVAPLMTCSARLPVYSIMIAAFIPYTSYFGILNLQGLVLTMLYLLGIIVAVLVSFLMKKIINRKERGSFIMEMPSYKVPTLRSVIIRVINRVKSFAVRAGTVILAITVIIWALSYYPRNIDLLKGYEQKQAVLKEDFTLRQTEYKKNIEMLLAGGMASDMVSVKTIDKELTVAGTVGDLENSKNNLMAQYQGLIPLVELNYDKNLDRINYFHASKTLANEKKGAQIRDSYLGIMGRKLEPMFRPLGWDWKITMSVLSSFPAREVIIATLGTIYNLGTDVEDESSSLIDKMRQARWEEGSKKGLLVFTPAVALSIMVFFALCCQCGATLVTMKQETLSWIHPIITFSYMTTLAYLTAMAVYQVFSRIGF